MIKFALLAGAGYSKNWGGWLASELWAVILAHPIVCDNQDLKDILWEYRERGFEEVFGDERIVKNYLSDYQKIVKDSFVQMHKAISTNLSDFNRNLYEEFISKFSNFFTLNQDLFFEALHPNFGNLSAKYFYPYVKSRSYFQYDLPRDLTNTKTLNLSSLMLEATLIPDAEPYDQTNNPLAAISGSNSQIPDPLRYYKLHGSLNFQNSSKDLLIMGGSKPGQIEKVPLLKRYHEDFKNILGKAKKLMIVGYSFGDYHINQKIFEAAEKNNLKFWIIDICDLSRLIRNAMDAEMRAKTHREKALKDQDLPAVLTVSQAEELRAIFKLEEKYEGYFRKGLISISRDSLRSIFTTNLLEWDRIKDRFFNK